MKKNFYALLAAAAVVVCFYACKKNLSSPIAEPLSDRNAQLNSIGERLGASHNSILDKAYKKLVPVKSKYTNMSTYSDTASISTVLAATTPQVAALPGFSSVSSVSATQFSTDIATVKSNLTPAGLLTLWTSKVSESVTAGRLTSREGGMVNEVINSLDSVYNLGDALPEVQHDRIRATLLAIKDKYKNTAFIDTEGELFTGVINIALASTEYAYMEDHDESVSGGPLGSGPGPGPTPSIWEAAKGAALMISIPEADAAGFLLGWAGAAIEEKKSNGELRKENQDIRISAGLLVAINTSFWGKVKIAPLVVQVTVPTINADSLKKDTVVVVN